MEEQTASVRGIRPLGTRFESLRAEWWPQIRVMMGEVVHSSSEDNSLIREMVDYHLETGGKRLRAILPLLTAEALGGDLRRMLPFAAACEMLHNASLVHDDIQDGDTVRRGQPTVWKRFSRAQAINLGDAMIGYTMLLMQRLEVRAALRELATRRVLLEMLRVIEGQIQDVDLKKRGSVSVADYLKMVEGKTARLFALPMSGAALLCGASSGVESGLAESARQIGVLFQIQDDVVDLFGQKQRAGAKSDIREGSANFLVAHCLMSAAPREARWLQTILEKPRDDTSNEEIRQVQSLLRRTGSLAAALDELDKRRRSALEPPALAPHTALLEVLDEACQIFLLPIRSLASPAPVGS